MKKSKKWIRNCVYMLYEESEEKTLKKVIIIMWKTTVTEEKNETVKAERWEYQSNVLLRFPRFRRPHLSSSHSSGSPVRYPSSSHFSAFPPKPRFPLHFFKTRPISPFPTVFTLRTAFRPPRACVTLNRWDLGIRAEKSVTNVKRADGNQTLRQVGKWAAFRGLGF